MTYRWTIADAYIPVSNTGGHVGHESVCALNATGFDAELTFVAYFADREPVTGHAVTVGARRARHLRTSVPAEVGLEIPAAVPYALEVLCDAPLDVQYSRLDTTQAAYTLMTSVLPRGDRAEGP